MTLVQRLQQQRYFPAGFLFLAKPHCQNRYFIDGTGHWPAMGLNAFLYSMAGRAGAPPVITGFGSGVYGCWGIGQGAGFASSGRSNAGGLMPLAPSGCMAVYPTVSERGFFAFAIMSAMGNFSYSRNRLVSFWRVR